MGLTRNESRTALRNLRRVYERASPEEVGAGEAWYRNAQLWCQVKAAEYGVGQGTVAGIVAALSPRLRWSQNRRAAGDVLDGRRPVGVFSSSVAKAERIRQSEDPLDVLRGPKTRAFYRALTGDRGAIVVDTIMLHALGLDPKVIGRVGGYASVAGVIEREARRQGYEGRESDFQAVVWVTQRGRAE